MNDAALREAVHKAMQTGDRYDIARVEDLLYLQALAYQDMFRKRVRAQVARILNNGNE